MRLELSRRGPLVATLSLGLVVSACSGSAGGQVFDGAPPAPDGVCELDASSERTDGPPVTPDGLRPDIKPPAPDATTDSSGTKADSVAPSTCGDGVINAASEACDGTDFGNIKSCKDFKSVYHGGTLKCTAGCAIDDGGCFRCGDGNKNGSEQCDTPDIGGATCASLGQGFAGGALTCSGQCTFDTSMCHRCGNNLVDATEECDGLAPLGTDCQQLGFDGGTLGCNGSCRYDTSGCTKNSCGNGAIDMGEDCDGTNVAGATCLSLGFQSGPLTCTANCKFDTGACYTCGDGKRNGPEQCDGADLDGATCASLGQGFDGGTLGCKTSCSYDTSACFRCGDGVKNATEDCDGADFGGATCASIGKGFTAGTLGCGAGCVFDTGQCTTCGNGIVETGEDCESGQPLAKTCQDLGLPGGPGGAVLSCDPASCTFKTASCWGHFVSLSAGIFTMGSKKGGLWGIGAEPCRESDEVQHSVTLTHAFEMQTTEVTRRQFKVLMGSSGGTSGCPDCPKDGLSWSEAAAYCNALSSAQGFASCYTCKGTSSPSCSTATAYAGAQIYACPGYRLPTEAEWEYAYRATTTTAYYNGDNSDCYSNSLADAIAWYGSNSSNQTHPVAAKVPNLWGLYDMAGNASEWCHDGDASYASGAVVDPVGVSNSNPPYHIVRGGAYSTQAWGVRAADRASSYGSGPGLRCVRTL